MAPSVMGRMQIWTRGIYLNLMICANCSSSVTCTHSLSSPEQLEINALQPGEKIRKVCFERVQVVRKGGKPVHYIVNFKNDQS